MEGFNNFEQGVLLACVVAATVSLMWLAIIFTTHCLRSIEIAYSLRRIKEVLAADANYRHRAVKPPAGFNDGE